MTDTLTVPRRPVTQLALHTWLAAHHAAFAGSEPPRRSRLLAWALLVASGGVDTVALVAAMPTVAEVAGEPEILPAYRAATDQAEQPLGHLDDEEPFDLAELYGNVGECEVEAVSRR